VKTILLLKTDAEYRNLGERIGLDTRVFLGVNDDH